jgi:preprotein translocase subunit SecE
VNRETKRLLQRQGQLDDEGNPAVGKRQPPRPVVQGGARALTDRTKPIEFLHEVRSELRRVAWPTRAETINSSIVVFIALVVLTSVIFGMDTLFSKFVLFLFKQ